MCCIAGGGSAGGRLGGAKVAWVGLTITKAQLLLPLVSLYNLVAEMGLACKGGEIMPWSLTGLFFYVEL